MGVLIVALLMTGVSVFLLLQPVLSGKGSSLADETEPSEAEFRKRVALRQLRDAEYEFAMGKLAEDDYQALRKELASEAITAIRAEEADDAAPPVTPSAEVQDLEAEIAAVRSRLRDGVFCRECGIPNPAGSRFCSECGQALNAPKASSPA
jgi:cytochrome c-type biogenesis protein CcmI